jgi:ABC-type antimicrobial peptide transport system permease subunit
LWGGSLGIFCGLVGGKIDDVVMRIIDAFLSIPWILAMLLIVSLLGTTTLVLIPALGFFYGKGIVRVARAATHDVIAKDFIVSARARGHSNMSIIWNEILPNVRDAIMVEGAMRWSWMLLGFSSLSFLGFGVSPPTPDWGLMISNARGLMSFAYWAVLAPIFGLSSLIIGINLTADAFAKDINPLAFDIIKPQSGVGGLTPNPKKDNELKPSNIHDHLIAPSTIIASLTLGKISFQIIDMLLWPLALADTIKSLAITSWVAALATRTIPLP